MNERSACYAWDELSVLLIPLVLRLAYKDGLLWPRSHTYVGSQLSRYFPPYTLIFFYPVNRHSLHAGTYLHLFLFLLLETQAPMYVRMVHMHVAWESTAPASCALPHGPCTAYARCVGHQPGHYFPPYSFYLQSRHLHDAGLSSSMPAPYSARPIRTGTVDPGQGHGESVDAEPPD